MNGRKSGMGNRETRRWWRGEKGGRRNIDLERYKVAFWNVAGVRGKDGEFWKGLEKWDVMVLSETWVEEKAYR